VAAKFPAQIDGFRKLLTAVKAYDDVSLDTQPISAREVVRRHLTDPLLEDMLFCPLMYYGSAQEHDMEFGQFVIMFKALFLEGFARPLEGVRVIIRVLLEKYRQAGGERRMKCGVQRIVSRAGRATALLLDTGEEITADKIISSIGAPETERPERLGVANGPREILFQSLVAGMDADGLVAENLQHLAERLHGHVIKAGGLDLRQLVALGDVEGKINVLLQLRPQTPELQPDAAVKIGGVLRHQTGGADRQEKEE